MLDIHPAQHAASTWRDFFIHIATIVIGLLIAIGLEQAVEAIHHRHERNVLIDDVHTEAHNNLQIFDENIRLNLAMQAWLKASMTVIQADVSQSPSNLLAGDREIAVTLPSGPTHTGDHAPSRAVWSVAKSNGKVALLPENLAEVYDRVDYDADQYFRARQSRLNVEVELASFEARIGTAVQPGVSLHLTPAECDELSRLLARYYAACRATNEWTGYWAGAADAVLHDVQSLNEIVPYLDRHAEGLRH